MTRVIVDRNAGFCAGVRRAIRGTERKLADGPPAGKRILSFGQLVHNREVTDDLAGMGLQNLERAEDAGPGDEVILRTHGISPREQRHLQTGGAVVTDFTCPRVKQVHEQIRDKRQEGCRVVIVGDPNHPEVKAQLGHAGEGAMILTKPKDAERVPAGRRIAVFAQTTISPQSYREVIDALAKRGLELSVADTICPYVQKRQRWIARYSKVADASLILGGRNSSNTRKLHDLAAANGPAILVGPGEELDLEQVLRHAVVALTAGASTSDRSIRAVLDLLRAAGALIEYR
jgi:4-hydroxy-3-methylbut-2-enyl diphosphate reductase